MFLSALGFTQKVMHLKKIKLPLQKKAPSATHFTFPSPGFSWLMPNPACTDLMLISDNNCSRVNELSTFKVFISADKIIKSVNESSCFGR